MPQSTNSPSTQLLDSKQSVSANVGQGRQHNLFHRRVYREMPSTVNWNHWSVESRCCTALLPETRSEEPQSQEITHVWNQEYLKRKTVKIRRFAGRILRHFIFLSSKAACMVNAQCTRYGLKVELKPLRHRAASCVLSAAVRFRKLGHWVIREKMVIHRVQSLIITANYNK